LRRRSATAVRIHSDAVMQESAGVNLSEGFLRGVVSEVLELSTDLLVHIDPLAERNFLAGRLVEILQIQESNHARAA
jgi:hypothetical protein